MWGTTLSPGAIFFLFSSVLWTPGRGWFLTSSAACLGLSLSIFLHPGMASTSPLPWSYNGEWSMKEFRGSRNKNHISLMFLCINHLCSDISPKSYRQMYSVFFFISMVINYHKLLDLNQHKLYSYNCVGQKSRISSPVTKYHSRPAVPNIFGTRDQFHGRQLSHSGDGSGSNANDGEQQTKLR